MTPEEKEAFERSFGKLIYLKQLCKDAWVIPPTIDTNSHHTCSICGEPIDIFDLLDDIEMPEKLNKPNGEK